MEATVVKEEVRGDRRYKFMSDGKILVESINHTQGAMFGTYEKITGEVTDEKIAKAKEAVVENVCKIIREIASTSESFFIIKPNPYCEEGECVTVGHKFSLPTVDRNDLHGLDEDYILY
jgi:hypothetical protein